MLISYKTKTNTVGIHCGNHDLVCPCVTDEEGATGRYVRKPEELAAAYTLMELHTDTAAAHPVVAPPRPPPLSSQL